NTTIQPFETVLQNRALRERLHRASVARGTRGNEFDTRATLSRVIALRQERAALLGYPTPAAFVLEDETAQSADTVNTLLRRLAPAALASATQEAAELQQLID
ncbi:M3 family metallopeptidase, partial [Escherichia coli]